MSTPLKGMIKFKPETDFGAHPGEPLRGFEPQPVTTLQGSLEINYINPEVLFELRPYQIDFVSRCNLDNLTVRRVGMHPAFEAPYGNPEGTFAVDQYDKVVIQQVGKLTLRELGGFQRSYWKAYGDYTNFYKAFERMTTKRKVKRAANILVKANRKNGTPCDPRKTYRELAKFARPGYTITEYSE